MRSTIFTTLLAVAISTVGVQGCSTESGVTVTFYGYPDNDPPGPGTAYNCGRNYVAGGSGTYSDPLTFASSQGEFTLCEVIYLPYLKKYLRFEDECVQCESDWNSGTWHIDVWTGSTTVNGGQTQINCEDALTPDAQTIVRSPDSTLTVDATALFSSGTCNTGHVYNNPTIPSCSGGGGSTTTCTWVGHCAGASCTTYNDCDGDLICVNGVCASG